MNNMQDGMLFRSKLHGYSKEDVNAYIRSLNANFASLEDGYKSMINHLKLDAEKAAESFNARSADFESQIKDLKAEIQGKDEKISELESDNCDLTNRVEELKKRIEELEDRLPLSKFSGISNSEPSGNSVFGLNDASRLSAKAPSGLAREFQRASSSNLSIAEKARLFDRFYARFRDILIDAKAHADRIVKEARFRAREIENMAGAQKSEKKAGAAFGVSDQSAFEKNDIYGCLSSMKDSIQTAMKDIDQRFRSVNEQMEKIRYEMDWKSEKSLDEDGWNDFSGV